MTLTSTKLLGLWHRLEPGHAEMTSGLAVIAECFDPSGTLLATGNVRCRLGPVRPKVG